MAYTSPIFKTQTNPYYINAQLVSRSKHSVSVIQTSQLMLYREIIAVCSEIHTKHINILCGRNVELLDVKVAVHNVTTMKTYGGSVGTASRSTCCSTPDMLSSVVPTKETETQEPVICS